MGGKQFIKQEYRARIPEYKYVGGDNSFLYRYVLSPWAQWLVDTFTPTWMAPNLITFVGLLFPGLTCLICFMVNPSLGSNCPTWLAILVALVIFIYQTLDNMDGKQARKTGTSSPHGMLFDHGCDAIQAGFSAVSMACVTGTGWGGALLFLSLTMGPFLYQSWEQFHIGEMFLPSINGPSDGIVIAVGVCVATVKYGARYWLTLFKIDVGQFLQNGCCYFGIGAFLGRFFKPETIVDTWNFLFKRLAMFPMKHVGSNVLLKTYGEESPLHTDLWWEGKNTDIHVTPFELFVAFFFTCTVATLIVNVTKTSHHVFLHGYGHGEGFEKTKQKYTGVLPVLKAYGDLFPLILLFSSAMYWLSNNTEFHDAIKELEQDENIEDPSLASKYSRIYPLLAFTIIANIFVEMSVNIMIMEICSGKLKPLSRPFQNLCLILPFLHFFDKAAVCPSFIIAFFSDVAPFYWETFKNITISLLHYFMVKESTDAACQYLLSGREGMVFVFALNTIIGVSCIIFQDQRLVIPSVALHVGLATYSIILKISDETAKSLGLQAIFLIRPKVTPKEKKTPSKTKASSVAGVEKESPKRTRSKSRSKKAKKEN